MKSLIASTAVALALMASAAPLQAQDAGSYPERPVTLVIPFGPGSGDAQARAFANIAEQHLGQQIIPENHPGGNSAIGVTRALSQPADGYTIMFLSGSFPLSVAQGQLQFSIDDVQPIIAFNADYLVIAVPANSPFQTFEELAAHATENPGDLSIGGTVLGGTHHMFAELVMDGAGIDMNYIPYEGANDTLVAMLGGTIDVMATSPSTVAQYVETGEVRLLGVSTADRVERYPDVPTFSEMGMERLADFINYRGYFTHPDVPEPIVARLSEAFTKAFESAEWQEYIQTERQIPFYRDYKGLAEHTKSYFESIQLVLSDMDKE